MFTRLVFIVLLIVVALSGFFIWHKHIQVRIQKKITVTLPAFFKIAFYLFVYFFFLLLRFQLTEIIYIILYFTVCLSTDYIRDSRKEVKEEIGWRFCAEVGLKRLRFKDQIY